jgi:chemotaxis protein methyltransferase CheR
MLVDMLLPQRVDWNILILGTDIDSAAIAKAQRGRFGQWSFRMVPEEIQQRYFHLEGNEWILDERIRRMVTFRISNLVSEPFPDSTSGLHNMDLIMCRNVFIYFDPAAVSSVAAKFAATLRAEGYLLTAHTELIGYPVRELETRLLAEGVVYRRRGRVSAESGNPPHRFHPDPISKADKSTLKKATIPPGVQPKMFVPESRKTVADISNKLEVKLPPPPSGENTAVHTPILSTIVEQDLLKEARAKADRGDFDLAERMCRKALDVDPLAAAAYYLLAQLAQIKGDSNHAKDCLNKTIYLAPRFVAAYLELAAICEREDDIKRAQTLRRAALGIVRTLPDDERIEQCETTAGELAQWLSQL